MHYRESSMPRRKVIIAILAAVVCGVLAVVFWLEEPEPVYKGKKLSEWIIDEDVQSVERREAILNLGSNAVPFLIKWAGYQPGVVKKMRYYIAKNGRRWFGLAWKPKDKQEELSFAVPEAFLVLGQNSDSAIPQLVAYATNSSKPFAMQTAINCLGLMGPSGHPSLLSLMTNETAIVRRAAMGPVMLMLNDQGTKAALALLFTHTNPAVRLDASNGLRGVAKQILGVPPK
jgi:hypothetical protein